MFIVDRVEGDRAVLEIGGERVDVPLAALPAGTREGDRLLLTREPAPTSPVTPVVHKKGGRIIDL